jgi:hypothetical protein
MRKIHGYMTFALAQKVSSFWSSMKNFEGRDDVTICIDRHWPPSEHKNTDGLLFGLYGDFKGALSSCYIGRMFEADFAVQIPDDEVMYVDNGLFDLAYLQNASGEAVVVQLLFDRAVGHTYLEFDAFWIDDLQSAS